MMTPLVIVGAGGHGREILDIVEAINAVVSTYDFLGFLDDEMVESEELARRGARVIGHSGAIVDIDAAYLIGIGDGDVRARLDQTFMNMGRVAARAVHPAASVGADTELADGLVMAAGARVTTNVRAGRHLYLSTNTTVAHDCRLGQYVTILTGANVCGNVSFEDGVTVGAGAVVIPGLRIGARAFIGAGAVVLNDIGPGVTAVGVPARPIRYRPAEPC